MEDNKQNVNLQQPIVPEMQTDLNGLQQYLGDPDPLQALCNSEIIDPIALQFIPKATWTSWKPTSIQGLHDAYFSRKNSVSRRFEHKLWNCLRITSVFPNLTKIIGVTWLDDKVIKVYKYPFAKFLAITCVDGGLFHKQGNFTRHGFAVLSEAEANQRFTREQLQDVDYREVTLIYHTQGLFTSESTEESISNCKWEDPTPSTRIAALKIQQPGEPSLE